MYQCVVQMMMTMRGNCKHRSVFVIEMLSAQTDHSALNYRLHKCYLYTIDWPMNGEVFYYLRLPCNTLLANFKVIDLKT